MARFPNTAPRTGTRSNGLIGNVDEVTKLGYYITPFGWVRVVQYNEEVFHLEGITYDERLVVTRYNNRMSAMLWPCCWPLSYRLLRHPGLATKRGFS